jgi:hypothetical protein
MAHPIAGNVEVARIKKGMTVLHFCHNGFHFQISRRQREVAYHNRYFCISHAIWWYKKTQRALSMLPETNGIIFQNSNLITSIISISIHAFLQLCLRAHPITGDRIFLFDKMDYECTGEDNAESAELWCQFLLLKGWGRGEVGECLRSIKYSENSWMLTVQ